MRVCGRCKKEQSEDAFAGARRTCTSCTERYQRWYLRNRDELLDYQRRYRQDNQESKAATDKRYREANAERIARRKRESYLQNREARLAKARAYREANPDLWRDNASRYYYANKDAVSQYNRRRREANRDAIAAYLREWGRANKDKRRVSNARRHAAKIAGAVDTFSAGELIAHYAAMGYDGCAYCPGPHEHDDHIVPLSRGGAHALENLAPACANCNVSKGAKMLAQWLGFTDRSVA